MNNLAKNTGASLINEVVSFAVGIIIPRLIISTYGSNVNGLVSSIAQFLGFISMCELGIGAVIKANLYKPLAKKDNYELSAVLVSAQRFFHKIAAIFVVYVAALVILYPSSVNSSFDYLYTASLIVIISVSLFAQYYFGMIYQLLLTANEQAYIQLYINCATLIGNAVACMSLIKMGASIHAVKLVGSLIYLLRPLLMKAYVDRHYSLDLKVSYEGEPIKQKWNGLAQHIATQVQDSVDVVILTLFSTLSNVSIYSVYYMIVKGIMQLVYTVNAGISAFLGKLIAKNDQEKLMAAFLSFEWGMHTASTCLFSVTAIMIVPFISIYTKGVTDANYSAPLFAVLITICGALRCIQLTYNVVVQAAGHFKQTQLAAIAEPFINIVLSLLAVRRFGLIGVTFGTIASLGYRVIYLLTYLKGHILNIRLTSTLKQIAVDILEIVCICLIKCCFVINTSNYFSWAIQAAITTVIVFLVCLMINFVFYRDRVLSLCKTVQKRFDKHAR